MRTTPPGPASPGVSFWRFLPAYSLTPRAPNWPTALPLARLPQRPLLTSSPTAPRAQAPRVVLPVSQTAAPLPLPRFKHLCFPSLLPTIRPHWGQSHLYKARLCRCAPPSSKATSQAPVAPRCASQPQRTSEPAGAVRDRCPAQPEDRARHGDLGSRPEASQLLAQTPAFPMNLAP